MESFWGTTNFKVAAAATAFGATLRQLDPVTCIVKEGGQRQVTFWFSSSGPDGDEADVEFPTAVSFRLSELHENVPMVTR